MRIVLASASPRRAELLEAAGFTFDVCAIDLDESAQPGEPPREYVQRLAVAKSARALEIVAQRDIVVIAADTAVIVDGHILGKPIDDEDAAQMLRLLSGRAHVVMTGVSVRTRHRQVDRVEETTVLVRALTDADVTWYVRTGEGRDKAGGYAIQGRASRFIPRIEGSYANVVGLPVATVAQLVGLVWPASGPG